MSRNKLSVISQKITKGGVDTLNLPRSSVHDAYMLKFNIAISNSGSAFTPTPEEILGVIDSIRLVTDSTRVHYDLTGMDVALMNVPLQKSGTSSFLFSTLSEVAASSGTGAYEFVLYLDQGDILACLHTNVELSVIFKDLVKTGVSVTSASCTVTIRETIFSEAELKAIYGEGYELSAEPKCYSKTVKCSANTEFIGYEDIPTGTLLKGVTLLITNDSGTLPDTVGILRNTPDRIELNKEDFATHMELDEILMGTQTYYKHTAGSKLAAMYNIDFGTQWQNNGVGKNGWSLAKGDVSFAMKTSAEQTIRIISKEQMVNAVAYANKGYTAY